MWVEKNKMYLEEVEVYQVFNRLDQVLPRSDKRVLLGKIKRFIKGKNRMFRVTELEGTRLIIEDITKVAI